MPNMTFFTDYIGHFLQSHSRHGVHSPFVYKLVDEVIYDFSSKPYEEPIEHLRRRLAKDKRMVTITDLGAGSMIQSKKEKSVSQIARHALKPKRIAQLLARLAAHTRPQTVVELGTCLGITTAYLASAATEAQLITVEGCPQTAAVAQENLNHLSLPDVDLRLGNFDEVLPHVLADIPTLDFLFVDGNHRKDATLAYFNQCLTKAHANSVFIFDDIYWSKGMKEAWTAIQHHPQVSVTLDLFYIGVVFFKTDQAKEHFKIRFQ